MSIYLSSVPRKKTNLKARKLRYVEKGICFKADTIEELAKKKMEVPVENLKATVDRYNELYRLGKDLDYGKRSELLTSIEKPPFYALKWGPALLNVHGGVLIDTKMRVLDKDHKANSGAFGRRQCVRRTLRCGLPAFAERQQPWMSPDLGAPGYRYYFGRRMLKG